MERPKVPRSVKGERSVPVIGLFVLAVLYTVYFARPFLLPVMLALFLVFILRPVVRALEHRLRLPLPVGAAVVVFGLLGLVGTGIAVLTPPAMEWVERAPSSMHDINQKISKLKRSVENMQRATQQIDNLTKVESQSRVREVAVAKISFGSMLLAGTQAFMLSAFSVVVLVFFLLASGDTLLRKVVKITPSLRDKIKAVEIARTVERDVGRYLLTLTGINLALGVATTLAMFALGMPNAMLWGAMAFALNFIPYLGATITVIVLTVVAVLTFDTIGHAALVPIVFLSITTLEGQILQPYVIGRSFSVNPVLVFLSLLFWGWMWGIAGMLMAVPILVAFKILCAHIESLASIHEFMER
ncbi:AI-2E family transporter [Uliginosibacterium sp. H3]|uniref:AI-2E family transporter n=1 Tax=Uliginosibacterium silvisoli TaxID=3114758 RepID=A0ABU6K9N5_9RHOO|nr:AI-2E family transporter [Uliginosibacterium sp. H3]